MYYKVVFAGENIFFENDSTLLDLTPMNAQPVIGFISCHYIHAETQDLAIATAKRDLLVNWNHSFNADRKLGMPKLTLQHIVAVNRWFKPKPTDDYHWFTSAAHKQEQLDKLMKKTSGWFGKK